MIGRRGLGHRKQHNREAEGPGIERPLNPLHICSLFPPASGSRNRLSDYAVQEGKAIMSFIAFIDPRSVIQPKGWVRQMEPAI